MPQQDHARAAVPTTLRSVELVDCLACGQVAEVTGTFVLPAGDHDEDYLRTRCLDGHLVVVPAFAVRDR